LNPLAKRLAAAAALALLPLAAAAQEKVVHVFNWSDYIDETILEEFTAETGIKVVYDVYDSNEILETKLLAGGSGYDVVVPSAEFMGRQIQAGVFQKLDKAKLPNLKHMWPEVTGRLAVFDPGNQHAVNYMWGTTGLGVNLAKVRQRLGQAALNTWDVVLKPEMIGKLKDCGRKAPAELDELLLDFFSRSGIPVVRDLPFGHHGDNLMLPIGARVDLDTPALQFAFPEPAVICGEEERGAS